MTRTGVPPPQTEEPATGVDHERFWRVLARFSETLVRRYELDEVLGALGDDICAVLDVAGAGVMLGDEQGHLRFTSTSDDVLHQLEQLQLALDEGPCLLAFRSSEVVLATDLRDDERFRRFGPRAVDSGMLAVYSFPMHMEGRVFGALNLYRGEPGTFTDDQVEVGKVFADVATSYLVNACDVEQKDLLTKQLQHALNSRVLIEQAKGFVAAQLPIGLPEAFELMRGYARRRQINIRMVARALLHGDLEVSEVTGA